MQLVRFILLFLFLMGSLCLVELTLPSRAQAMPLPQGYQHVSRRLLHATHTVSEHVLPPLPTPRGFVIVDGDGYVLSTNPVWNACVRGGHLLPSFIRSNSDVFTHRQGRVTKPIPLTCRDYRRGNVHIWKHPDFIDVELYIDSKGRLLGVLTQGFIIQREV